MSARRPLTRAERRIVRLGISQIAAGVSLVIAWWFLYRAGAGESPTPFTVAICTAQLLALIPLRRHRRAALDMAPSSPTTPPQRPPDTRPPAGPVQPSRPSR